MVPGGRRDRVPGAFCLITGVPHVHLKTGLRAEVAWDAKAMLGESPLWDERAQCLYWVDIEGATLYRQEPGKEDETTALPLETQVGSIAPRESGGLVAASYKGFAFLDPTDGRLDRLSDPESHLPDNRFNDGKCDPAGRFIAGSRHYLEVAPSAVRSISPTAPSGTCSPSTTTSRWAWSGARGSSPDSVPTRACPTA